MSHKATSHPSIHSSTCSLPRLGFKKGSSPQEKVRFLKVLRSPQERASSPQERLVPSEKAVVTLAKLASSHQERFLASREVRSSKVVCHLTSRKLVTSQARISSRRRHHSPSRSITAHFFEIMQRREPHRAEPVEIPIAVHLCQK
jgi:hypothetical protein